MVSQNGIRRAEERFAFRQEWAHNFQRLGQSRLKGTKNETMNQEKRVLSRIGARELTREEMEHTSGGFAQHTNTACIFTGRQLDAGDRGECPSSL